MTSSIYRRCCRFTFFVKTIAPKPLYKWNSNVCQNLIKTRPGADKILRYIWQLPLNKTSRSHWDRSNSIQRHKTAACPYVIASVFFVSKFFYLLQPPSHGYVTRLYSTSPSLLIWSSSIRYWYWDLEECLRRNHTRVTSEPCAASPGVNCNQVQSNNPNPDSRC